MYGFDNKYPYTDFHELNLDWILKQVKANKISIEECLKLIEKWSDKADKIIELYQAIITGDFPPEFENAIVSWLQENAVDIVGDLVHMVFFGLTLDGYFVAYVPESWDDITFNTSNYDITIPDTDFGRLVLSY